MEKTIKNRAPRKAAQMQGAKRAKRMPPAAAVAASALCGAAVTVALLCLFALVYEKLFLPLQLVRPLACVAAGMGAGVSGLVLAGLIRCKKLLCGAGCGLLFAACAALATVLAGCEPVVNNANLAFLLLLLAAGTTGGAVSALIQPADSAAVR